MIQFAVVMHGSKQFSVHFYCNIKVNYIVAIFVIFYDSCKNMILVEYE